MKKSIEYLKASLFAGAIGDALGWPIEFKDIEYIRRNYGTEGCTDLILNSRGFAEVTDDTQMTLFTLEGIVNHLQFKRFDSLKESLHHSYLRWYKTQNSKHNHRSELHFDLLNYPALYYQRSPGVTCLTALARKVAGTVEKPINDSKGCGGVMRVAPIGYFFNPDQAFDHGCDAAAITHGHPLGYLSAGALAYLMAWLFEGETLQSATEKVITKLERYPAAQPLKSLLVSAVELSRSSQEDEKCIRQLGAGWVAEEALAIALYCSLRHSMNLHQALIAAVNHSGDSDSTGSITGNILGAVLGMGAIEEEWIRNLDVTEIVIDFLDVVEHRDKS